MTRITRTRTRRSGNRKASLRGRGRMGKVREDGHTREPLTALQQICNATGSRVRLLRAAGEHRRTAETRPASSV